MAHGQSPDDRPLPCEEMSRIPERHPESRHQSQTELLGHIDTPVKFKSLQGTIIVSLSPGNSMQISITCSCPGKTWRFFRERDWNDARRSEIRSWAGKTPTVFRFSHKVYQETLLRGPLQSEYMPSGGYRSSAADGSAKGRSSRLTVQILQNAFCHP